MLAACGCDKTQSDAFLQPCSNTPPQWRLFRDGEYTLQLDTRSGTPTLMISIQNAVEPVASPVRECPIWDGLPLTLDVSATFPEGAAVRDYYSQQIAIVKNGQITLQPAATSNGLLLLERAETDALPLSTGITPRFTLC